MWRVQGERSFTVPKVARKSSWRRKCLILTVSMNKEKSFKSGKPGDQLKSPLQSDQCVRGSLGCSYTEEVGVGMWVRPDDGVTVLSDPSLLNGSVTQF